MRLAVPEDNHTIKVLKKTTNSLTPWRRRLDKANQNITSVAMDDGETKTKKYDTTVIENQIKNPKDTNVKQLNIKKIM